MTKKTYTIPQSISNDITSTINIVKNNIGTLNYRVVPLDIIEFDPENPRELSITRDDILHGLKSNDSLLEKKQKDLASLQELAETIKKFGVRNAVEIYKFDNKYRLIHGERRCLASILAGKKDIQAKVLDEKPNNFDIRLLQLIENIQREDLTLAEFLNNIRSVIEEYKKHIKTNVVVNSNFLEQLINKSKTQCFNILSVINAPKEIQDYINNGKIKNIEKAALIANEKDPTLRNALLTACLKGISIQQLKEVKQGAKQQKLIEVNSILSKSIKLKPGKKASKVYMGETKNKGVIAKLINLVIQDPSYSSWSDAFKGFELNDYDSCNIAFKKLITVMEKIETN